MTPTKTKPLTAADCTRNSPCYCGSGKKFKKCCQAKFPGHLTYAQSVTRSNAIRQAMEVQMRAESMSSHPIIAGDGSPTPDGLLVIRGEVDAALQG